MYQHGMVVWLYMCFPEARTKLLCLRELDVMFIRSLDLRSEHGDVEI